MRKYELMIVLDPAIDPNDGKKRDAVIGKLLGDLKKTVVNVTDLGKKRLRYEIDGKNEGVYVLLSIEAESLKSADIEKQKRLTPEVLRYLLIKGA